MSAHPRTSGGRLDRLYARLGHRYALVIASTAVGISIISTLLNGLLILFYLDLGSGELLLVAVASVVADLLGVGLTLLIYRNSLLRIYGWVRAGEPPGGARQVLELVNQLPVRIVPRAAVLIMLLELPVVMSVSGADSVFSSLILFAGALETVAAAALFIFLVMEQMLRPIARRAQQQAGLSGFSPPQSAVSLRRKLLVGLPIVCVMTAYVAVALSSQASTDNGRLAVGVAAALLVSITVSLILTATLSRSLSEPVGELVAATEDVEAGDLSARVHPLAGDELGVLTGRFNQMLDGLVERESLRETNVELVDELRRSRARIVAAADASRQAVERDLHDGAQQHLVLLDMKLGLARKEAEGDPEAVARLDEARGTLARALDELRDLAHGIYPQVLSSDGLPGALADAAQRSAIPAEVDCDGARRYPPEIEAAIYFCCLEALQNAAKYAGEGATAKISLAEVGGELRFDISDDGSGFDSAPVNGSSGLQNMADRIGALGGTLTIESAPGNGTRVTGAIPPILTRLADRGSTST